MMRDPEVIVLVPGCRLKLIFKSSSGEESPLIDFEISPIDAETGEPNKTHFLVSMPRIIAVGEPGRMAFMQDPTDWGMMAAKMIEGRMSIKETVRQRNQEWDINALSMEIQSESAVILFDALFDAETSHGGRCDIPMLMADDVKSGLRLGWLQILGAFIISRKPHFDEIIAAKLKECGIELSQVCIDMTGEEGRS